MTNDAEIVKLYLRLVENPHAAKHYRDLADYYRTVGMTEEAAGFDELLKKSFSDDTNDTPADPQQRADT
jgi:hypothetical protein